LKAHTPDELGRRFATIIRTMVDDEVARRRRLEGRASPGRGPKAPAEYPADRLDNAVLEACRRVAAAVDRMEGAEGTRDMVPARKALFSVTTQLRNLMKKRGTSCEN
jgi:hypothetical protein